MGSLGRPRVITILLLLSSLLVSCGGQSAPPSPAAGQPAATAVPATKPQANQELVWATPSFGNEAWVAGLAAATDDFLAAPMYDQLAYTKPGTDELIAGLAERWEASPDKTKWTFYLRKGVQFHDGYGELTAADVKYTIETIASKDSVAVAKGYFSRSLKSIETPDPYTVVITLNKGDWSFAKAYVTSSNSSYTRIMSKQYVEKVGLKEAAKKPIGSGPYKFHSYNPGEFLKMEALPSHWRVTPEFKYLTFKLVPEEAARVAMMKSGEADITEASADASASLEKAGFSLRKVPGGMYEHIILGGMVLPTDPAYDEKIPWFLPKEPDRALKVRKAMNMAVDRKAIMDKLFQGQGEPGAVFDFFPGQSGYDNNWKPYPYDPAGAKKLLAEAGYPNGFDMTMYLWIMPGRTELPDLGEIVSGMWEQNLGLKIKRVTGDLAMVRDMQVGRKTGQATITAALGMYAEPSLGWFTVTHSKSTAGQFMSAHIDGPMEKAYFELDDAKRAQVTREFGQFLYENYIDVPVGIRPQVWIAGPRVGEWPLTLGVMFVQNGEYVKMKR